MFIGQLKKGGDFREIPTAEKHTGLQSPLVHLQ
jgi:hypothetical protein